jgi:hypothetical protein
LDTQFGFALDSLTILQQMHIRCNFKGPCTWHHTLIIIDILNRPQPIPDGILNHRNSMLVGPLNQNGAAPGVLHSLNKRVFLFAEGHFVDLIGIAQIVFSELLDGVDGAATAGEDDSFHVSALGPPKCDDVLFGEGFQADWVHSLLVDNDEGFVVAVADFFLKGDDLLAALVGEFPLASGEFFSVFGIAEEELRVDFGLLIFKTDIAGEDIAIRKSLGHIWMPSTMIQHQTLHKLGVSRQLVLHMHDLNHMQVNGGIRHSE